MDNSIPTGPPHPTPEHQGQKCHNCGKTEFSPHEFWFHDITEKQVNDTVSPSNKQCQIEYSPTALEGQLQ
jgi:hypothetical protein